MESGKHAYRTAGDGLDEALLEFPRVVEDGLGDPLYLYEKMTSHIVLCESSSGTFSQPQTWMPCVHDTRRITCAEYTYHAVVLPDVVLQGAQTSSVSSSSERIHSLDPERQHCVGLCGAQSSRQSRPTCSG